ncbi:MAG: glycoside hydrolase family 3 protein [Acidobacteria bacterium]|nr:glycoside hydrolase family 3 protein [Acidobacteriota bacterium]
MEHKKTIVGVILSLLLALCLVSCKSPEEKAALAEQKKIGEIIAKMTLEEKAALVVGAGRNMPGQDGENAVARTRELVPGAAGTTAAFEQLGITPMVLADGPAGLRISPTRADDTVTYYCTAFPISTLLASSWDTELVYRVGQAMGKEVLEYGADILLAPALNLHRNPLCGRNFEYYSEDPLIAGRMTAAMVKGVQSQGVGTAIKHFAANNQEANRSFVDTIASERALRELYLEGFRIAVEEAEPWTVMSSYNKINGTYASESHDLLTKILRQDWGFQGFVMTDWGGGSDPVAQMKAGNDLLMPGNARQAQAIIAAVKEGQLDEGVLDENAARILRILFKSPRYRQYPYSNQPDLKAHAAVARRAGAEGMVLLKNDPGVLPFADGIKTVAAFGNTSYEIITGGTGSGDVNEAYSVSLIEGLDAAGYSVHKALQDLYSGYIKEERAKQAAGTERRSWFMGRRPIAEMDVRISLVNRASAEADIALITIGRNSGEGSDRKDEEGDFYLTEWEKSLIRSVSKTFQDKGKNTVVVLNVGGVIETASWRNDPGAILLAWQPGQEAGHSIADVLSGKVNPSGRLAASFPLSYADVPSAGNFPGILIESEEAKAAAGDPNASFMPRMAGRKAEVVYGEDIYVGYRYYNSFDRKVAYEFGYGLSYTRFAYSNLNLGSGEFEDSIPVSVDIENAGPVAGKEVVQVYLSAPAGQLDKPREELVAFDKTELLEPGQKQTLTFELSAGDLASFDTASSSWLAEAGEYTVKAGASSRDIKQTASFRLGRDVVVNKVNKALSPQREINTLRP